MDGAVLVAAYLRGLSGFAVVEVAQFGAVIGDAILRGIELLRTELEFVFRALVLLDLGCVILLAVVMELPVWYHQVPQALLLWAVGVILVFLVAVALSFSLFVVQIHF